MHSVNTSSRARLLVFGIVRLLRKRGVQIQQRVIFQLCSAVQLRRHQLHHALDELEDWQGQQLLIVNMQARWAEKGGIIMLITQALVATARAISDVQDHMLQSAILTFLRRRQRPLYMNNG